MFRDDSMKVEFFLYEKEKTLLVKWTMLCWLKWVKVIAFNQLFDGNIPTFFLLKWKTVADSRFFFFSHVESENALSLSL